MSDSRLDMFFSTVARESRAQIGHAEALHPANAHWVVVEDGDAVEVTRLDESLLSPDPVIDALVEQGATAAAYVTYLPGHGERVIAYAVVADPRDSDVRWSPVAHDWDARTLGPWQAAL
jgi:hypothetical protein